MSTMSKTRALMTETEREQIAGDHGRERQYQATSRVRDRLEALERDIETLQKNDPALYMAVLARIEGPLEEQHELSNWLESKGGVKNPHYEEQEWSVTPLVGEIEYGEPINTGGPIDTIPDDELTVGVYEMSTMPPEYGDSRWMQYALVQETDPFNWKPLNTPKELLVQFADTSTRSGESAFTTDQLLLLADALEAGRGWGMPPVEE